MLRAVALQHKHYEESHFEGGGPHGPCSSFLRDPADIRPDRRNLDDSSGKRSTRPAANSRSSASAERTIVCGPPPRLPGRSARAAASCSPRIPATTGSTAARRGRRDPAPLVAAISASRIRRSPRGFLGGPDQPRMRDGDRVQRPLQGFEPEGKEPIERGKFRTEIVVLPDVSLQQRTDDRAAGKEFAPWSGRKSLQLTFEIA